MNIKTISNGCSSHSYLFCANAQVYQYVRLELTLSILHQIDLRMSKIRFPPLYLESKIKGERERERERGREREREGLEFNSLHAFSLVILLLLYATVCNCWNISKLNNHIKQSGKRDILYKVSKNKDLTSL